MNKFYVSFDKKFKEDQRLAYGHFPKNLQVWLILVCITNALTNLVFSSLNSNMYLSNQLMKYNIKR